jgi:uncharacterized protein
MRISSPAGQVDHLDLHPMTFTEFLMALGEGRYADLLKADTLELASAMAEHLRRPSEALLLCGRHA